MKKTLALLFLLALGAAAIPFFLPEPAQLELMVEDSTFGLDPTGSKAVINDLRNGLSISLEVLRGEDGLPRLLVSRIPAGEGELLVAVEGFEEETLRLYIPPLVRSRMPLPLKATYGRALVSILDAKTGDPLEGATLEAATTRIRRGPEGTEVFLPAGRHSLGATAGGHCQASKTFEIRHGGDTRVALGLSPHLVGAEAARIVLDWGENPRDLDAHVLLDATGAPPPQTHAYFNRKEIKTTDGRPLAQLDVDYLNSEGLETITVHNSLAGTYRYFVDHYAGSGTLASSEAQVTVSTRGCKQKTYTVPPGCSLKFWEVVDLKVSGDTVEILERGSCTKDAPRKWRNRKG